MSNIVKISSTRISASQPTRHEIMLYVMSCHISHVFSHLMSCLFIACHVAYHMSFHISHIISHLTCHVPYHTYPTRYKSRQHPSSHHTCVDLTLVVHQCQTLIKQHVSLLLFCISYLLNIPLPFLTVNLININLLTMNIPKN